MRNETGATYKRLRHTLPRNAVYFLGRILEISRSEYDPSDMDILKAEGLSSTEGLSCVDFSFPLTTQEGSLEDDYHHDPKMKYQLIRLNHRSLGENWKWLEMFEDADLVIFCVSLTDYGEYIEDVDGVLVNKMIANKQLFESMVTHPSLANKRFLLLLTKFDLLEDKIEEVPLRNCEWFEDFNPLISQNQTSRHNPPMAQRAFHYIGFQFKRLYDSLSMRRRSFKPKLFVSQVSLESDSVDNALRVPSIQATYKRLRHTLPRNAVYFLGRIFEISRSEYDPSDMDILKAEGLSSTEGLSCVDFSFPLTTQEGSLEDDYHHDPKMKYQLIRLNHRSLGENWKWLEMFEDADLVIFCVSLTDYGEYIEDVDGVLVNKMIANKQLFESMVTHPSLANKRFLLLLTKFDLLEDKIEEVPLRTCEWFEDFNPLISQNQTSRHNPPMAQRAFHYIGFQFKRLYDSLSMRRRSFKPKLFVSQVSLESDSVDNALRYAREILKWHVEEGSIFQETSTTSFEASLSS
ncbi:hypothetical protein F2Q68_00037804 [Brassica cretica]|uniref:Uncharacterized protein n=1 Tax=Brassica cretica TaxID=69181 RepID=A0A8S9H2R7_BRACR|nr:hypothetical protein F2Q68_00037804 [Brassica cretica]